MPRPTVALPLARLPKTALMRSVERAHAGRDIRLILMDAYNQLGSQAAVAAALGLTQVTVQRWLTRCGIQTVTWTEAFIAPPKAECGFNHKFAAVNAYFCRNMSGWIG